MDLQELQRRWDQMAATDPLWGILNWPGKRGQRWDLQEFFRTGEDEISEVMRYLGSIGCQPEIGGRALDFGCGVGRVTQALARLFRSADGVDISVRMIELARTHNRHGARCRYHVNLAEDLRLFQDAGFDFVYTNIVLQHMEPRYAKGYIRELVRVLAPGGILVFQLPSERLTRPPLQARPSRWRQLARSVLPAALLRWRQARRRPAAAPPPSEVMHGVPQAEVREILEQCGATLVNVQQYRSAGPDWESFRYCARRPAASA